ncbi:recombination regulator RecX [Gammaproteobacteria bacterium]|nr:recombination regulator RecX [Gammaproteobacteria bacterium]
MSFKRKIIEDKDIRKKLLDFLSRREHSFKELIFKLEDRVSSSERLFLELEKLREEGLQSDERFTESFTRSRSIKGFGPEKISNELRSKGIEDNLIKKMVYSQELDWKIILKKEFKKKYSQSKIYNIEDISKIKKFFFQRGFLIDEINELFKK